MVMAVLGVRNAEKSTGGYDGGSECRQGSRVVGGEKVKDDG